MTILIDQDFVAYGIFNAIYSGQSLALIQTLWLMASSITGFHFSTAFGIPIVWIVAGKVSFTHFLG
jgi:hypothetical protein